MTWRDSYPTWVEVDLQAIENNVRRVIERTQCMVMAVVKADAYGHGAEAVAKAALRAGATWCAVARLDEALALREAGLGCPILLFGWVPPRRIREAIDGGISLTYWDSAHLMAAGRAAQRVGREARVHLKVDTGMGRLGVLPQQAPALIAEAVSTEGVKVEGVYTHFARADEADPQPTAQQLETFLAVLDALEAAGLKPPLVHAANSAAAIRTPEAWFNLVRFGIAMYGLQPSANWPLPPGFRPALRWKTQLIQVKELPPGSGISYGHAYVTRSRERIGTLPLGYADGFRRWDGNEVLLRGRRVLVVGRVCMDQCLLQLDAVPEAEVGEEIVLIGEQDGAQITAEEVALRWGTINYEVTSAIGARVPRFYSA